MKTIWMWLASMVLVTTANAQQYIPDWIIIQESPTIINGPVASKKPTKPWRGIGKITFKITDDWEKSGTCVLIKKDIILTAESLVRNEEAKIELPGGSYTGTVIASHQQYNWALIKLHEIPNAKPVPISMSGPPIGDKAWLFGYGEFFGVTPVILKSNILIDGEFQVTAKPKTGDLGAPIISQDSKLVGLYTDYRNGIIDGFGLDDLVGWIDIVLAANSAPPEITGPPEIAETAEKIEDEPEGETQVKAELKPFRLIPLP